MRVDPARWQREWKAVLRESRHQMLEDAGRNPSAIEREIEARIPAAVRENLQKAFREAFTTVVRDGGGVIRSSVPEEAARREFFEETGLTAEELTPLGAFSGPDTRHTYPNGDRVFIVGIFFLCTRFSGEPLIDPDEVTELRWFPLDALPAAEAINPPDRRAFAAFAKHMRAL